MIMDDSDKIKLALEKTAELEAANTALVAENQKLVAERDALLAKLEEKAVITKQDSDEIKAAEVTP